MNKEIRLSEAEQLYLKDFVKNGSHKSKEIIRARVLLMLDRTGKVDHVRYNRTAEYAGISVQAVYNMRDEYLEISKNRLSKKRVVVYNELVARKVSLFARDTALNEDEHRWQMQRIQRFRQKTPWQPSAR